MFVTSMATLDAIAQRDSKVRFKYVAGHSLGDITAMCISGIINRPTALKIIVPRNPHLHIRICIHADLSVCTFVIERKGVCHGGAIWAQGIWNDGPVTDQQAGVSCPRPSGHHGYFDSKFTFRKGGANVHRWNCLLQLKIAGNIQHSRTVHDYIYIYMQTHGHASVAVHIHMPSLYTIAHDAAVC